MKWSSLAIAGAIMTLAGSVESMAATRLEISIAEMEHRVLESSDSSSRESFKLRAEQLERLEKSANIETSYAYVVEALGIIIFCTGIIGTVRDKTF